MSDNLISTYSSFDKLSKALSDNKSFLAMMSLYTMTSLAAPNNAARCSVSPQQMALMSDAQAPLQLLWESYERRGWSFIRENSFLLRTKGNKLSVEALTHEQRLSTFHSFLEAQGAIYMAKVAEGEARLTELASLIEWNQGSTYSASDIAREYKLKVQPVMMDLDVPYVSRRTDLHAPKDAQQRLEIQNEVRLAAALQHFKDLKHIVNIAADAAAAVNAYNVPALESGYEVKKKEISTMWKQLDKRMTALAVKQGRRTRPGSGSPQKNVLCAADREGDPECPADESPWGWQSRYTVNNIHKELQQMHTGEGTQVLTDRVAVARIDVDAVLSKLRALFDFTKGALERETEYESEINTLQRDIIFALEFVRRRKRYAMQDAETLQERFGLIEKPEDMATVLQETDAQIASITAEQAFCWARLKELSQQRNAVVQSRIKRVHRIVNILGRTEAVRHVVDDYSKNLRALIEADSQREADYTQLSEIVARLAEIRKGYSNEVGLKLRNAMLRTHRDVIRSGTVMHAALHDESQYTVKKIQQAQLAVSQLRELMTFCRKTKDPSFGEWKNKMDEVLEVAHEVELEEKDCARQMEELLQLMEPSSEFLKSIQPT